MSIARVLKNSVSYITFIGVKRRTVVSETRQFMKHRSLDGLSSIDYISFYAASP
jgi:hypothetical protein